MTTDKPEKPKSKYSRRGIEKVMDLEPCDMSPEEAFEDYIRLPAINSKGRKRCPDDLYNYYRQRGRKISRGQVHKWAKKYNWSACYRPFTPAGSNEVKATLGNLDLDGSNVTAAHIRGVYAFALTRITASLEAFTASTADDLLKMAQLLDRLAGLAHAQAGFDVSIQSKEAKLAATNGHGGGEVVDLGEFTPRKQQK